MQTFYSKTDIQSQSLEIDAGLPVTNQAAMQDYQNRLIWVDLWQRLFFIIYLTVMDPLSSTWNIFVERLFGEHK